MVGPFFGSYSIEKERESERESEREREILFSDWVVLSSFFGSYSIDRWIDIDKEGESNILFMIGLFFGSSSTDR
jgi:hypothetical protein